MITTLETKTSIELESFINDYNNPKSLWKKLSQIYFIEWNITRIKDLIIIQQVHMYDVIAKWLLWLSVVDMIMGYTYNHPIIFFIGVIFMILGVMWLSPIVRGYILIYQIKKRGHKEKITYINPRLLNEKLLLELKERDEQNGTA